MSKKSKLEPFINVTIYDGTPREEVLTLYGVNVGMIDTRLLGVYHCDLELFITDWSLHILDVINKKWGISLRNAKDVKKFLALLEKENSSFKMWWESYMKKELLKINFDYDAIAAKCDK